MPRLAFVVPVHGRLELASVCLRQLRRTCDALTAAGVDARAVVVSDADSLETLDPADLGFATVERDNDSLGRRFNDGIQLATDPAYGVNADYVVPFGSDDWADHRLFLPPFPGPNEIQGFQQVAFVSEDGQEIASTYIGWTGGSGIRIIPRELVEPLGFRPCSEDRPRGCDTSILANIQRAHNNDVKVRHLHIHDFQIVDWKSGDTQLNSYRDMTTLRNPEVRRFPFDVLAEFYPAEAVAEMKTVYREQMAYA